MTLLEFLNHRAERTHQLKIARMKFRHHMIDARGWVGIGVYLMAIMDLWMIVLFPELRADEFFKAVSMLIIGTGFINGVVSWAYSATKAGGELADRNADLVERQTRQQGPTGNSDDPIHTQEEN